MRECTKCEIGCSGHPEDEELFKGDDEKKEEPRNRKERRAKRDRFGNILSPYDLNNRGKL